MAYGHKKIETGSAFRLLLEGQALEGAATIVEHVETQKTGQRLLQLDIHLYDASQQDIDFIMSMKSLSDTGTNFVRLGADNYDPDAPADELATAFALMGEAPHQYEGMVLRAVQVTRLFKGRMNVKIVALQLFKPNKEVSP